MTEDTVEYLQYSEPTPQEREARSRHALIVSLHQLRELEEASADGLAWVESITSAYRADQAKRDAAMAELRQTIQELALELRVPRRQYAEIPGFARVQLQTNAESVRIVDRVAAMAWAREHPDEKVIRRPTPAPLPEPTLDANAYKALGVAALKDGELLPGLERVPETTELKTIQWRDTAEPEGATTP